MILGCVVLGVFGLGVRLAVGPLNVDGLKPIIVDRIQSKLPHSRVTIRHLSLVWFGDARAVGFRFDDLMVLDDKNRVILRAGKLETALAADSLLLLHFDPARLTAEDFFAAASVSREGKYELGYEAHGAPEAMSGLDRVLGDLTGPEQLGHPFSFARQMALKNGEFRLMQTGAPLDWTARVSTIDFSKLNGHITSHLNLTIDSPGSTAALTAAADATVGLKHATIAANVANLVPARVFPSVGATQFLSLIDAPLSGQTRVTYSAAKGFEGATADLKAAQGHLNLGHSRQAFDGANIVAHYTSATHTATFQKFNVQAHLIDTDLHGKIVISPENAKAHRDLKIDFDFSGPRVTGRLADDFGLQTLTQAHFKGDFTPRLRQVNVTTGTGLLNGAPFETKGLVYTDEQGQLGADLTAKIKGRFTKDEVFAFWPEDLSHILRKDLIERIKGGDFANADFVLKAQPGEFAHLSNDNLRLDFDFWNAEIGVEHKLHNAEGMKGHAILLGDSFALDATEGHLLGVNLIHGGMLVPSFHKHDTETHIWVDTQADVVDVVEAVDPITDGDLAKHGLNRSRLAGQAKTRVDITFPTFHEITARNFGLTFDAHVSDGGFKQAALGWDLTQGALDIRGDLLADKLIVHGPARVGPFTGDIVYDTQFSPKTQRVTLDGHFNAGQFGGNPRVPVPIKGLFTIADGKGQGSVTSDIFNGDVAWTNENSDDPERPSQVTINGFTLAKGMEAQGLPMFEHLKPELPTRISLLRSGEIWSGELDAEALSGDLAYIQGERPRLVYKSIITPDEAAELGYGALPVFKEPRHLTVNIALDPESKEALLKLDALNAVLGWSEQPNSDELLRKLTMTLQPADWETLGLPTLFFKPIKPVDVTALWQQTPDALAGTVSLLDQTIDFDMPTREAIAAAPKDKPLHTLRVRGVVDDTIRQTLGYSQTPVRISGPLGMTFSLYDAPGQPAGVLNVDASEAELGVRATDWKKPVGEAASFAVSFDDQGPQTGRHGGVNLSRIYGTGDRIRIDGRASFSEKGDLEFADFSSLYLRDFIDVTFKYYVLPDQQTNVMAISGQQLDLRPWLQNDRPDAVDLAAATTPAAAARVAPQAAEAQTPTHFVVDLARLQTSPAGAFSNIKLDVNWDGRNRLNGQGTGRTINGSAIAVAFAGQANKPNEKVSDQDAYSLFAVRTNDFGDTLRTFSGIANVYGGTALIEGAYRGGQIDASIRGQQARVKQIPALAQLLTVASLTGLNDTLTGEGIGFDDFDFPVRYRDNTVFIRSGWAKGRALGVNVWGTTDLDRKTLALSGTLIPAYRFNALFGDVKTNGLGLVGIKYTVKGGYKLPQVGVNPLSVIMPGFMKVWENDQRKDPIPPLDVPAGRDTVNSLREKTAEAVK